MDTVLSRRALNRATLDRQLLLRRTTWSVPAVVEHLGGLQAQTPHTWYAGLWNRIEGFLPEHAASLLTDRTLVRIALMRSTIHLVTARDCLAFRPLVEPVIERSMRSNFGRNLTGLDAPALVAEAARLLGERPMTFAELGKRLGETWPDRDQASLCQAVRAWLPLVQVPPRGLWGRSGPIAHTTAQAWLGQVDVPPMTPGELVVRYLTAFGPATVKDAQTWSGLTRLSEVIGDLDLVRFRDEQGRQLYDLPDAPRPDPEVEAPVRFLYDYDNLLLSHADRSRVITDGYFAQNFAINGPMPCVVLVDGCTAATWKVTKTRGTATLEIHPFGRVPRDDVEKEGAALLAFLAPGNEHDLIYT